MYTEPCASARQHRTIQNRMLHPSLVTSNCTPRFRLEIKFQRSEGCSLLWECCHRYVTVFIVIQVTNYALITTNRAKRPPNAE